VEEMAMQGNWTPETLQFKILCPNNKDKISSCINLDTGPAFEYSYTSLITGHDFENVVCELSKFMDGAIIAAHQEIIRDIRFVLDTRDTCLKLKSKLDDENWELVVYGDSD
jgi:hypothetical protein